MIPILLLPIVLVHGYGEDSHVWDSWANWLKAEHFNVTEAVTSQCGSVEQNAIQLSNQIHGKVNIIAHSKGGLDARWYIAHYHQNRVMNLVMIATPNLGTTAAYTDLTTTCSGGAGLEDLQPNSKATQVVDQPRTTHYYTIAGNYSDPCYFVVLRYISCYIIPNDGMVTVSSAQSNYTSLGVFAYNHTGLLQHVYQNIVSILK
jgi:triacylglycerol esterase/lipase EstA (alpha/beta hydrolase family)